MDEAASTSFEKFVETTWASAESESLLVTPDCSENMAMRPAASAPTMRGVMVTTMTSSINVKP
jgi:hypothetical protein